MADEKERITEALKQSGRDDLLSRFGHLIDILDGSPNPRELALMLLGLAIGAALRVGVTLEEIRAVANAPEVDDEFLVLKKS
jgi:phosphoglycolate phosphatase-like HAD superfamily hydrolase